MATFTQLPAELLHHLLRNFEDDKPTLCQLSLVSPLFATVAQELLLRHLDLSVDTRSDGLETSFDKLIKLLDEKPQLSTHIQNLTIFSERGWNPSLDSINRVVNLLNRAISLRSLDLNHELMVSQVEDEEHPFNFFLQTSPLARLARLTLRNPFIEWTIFIQLVHLPKLEYLVLDNLPISLSFYPAYPQPPDWACWLRKLEIGCWRRQPNSALKELLETTTRLEELILRMEQEEAVTSSSFTCLPSDASKALTPVQDTLRILTITGPAVSPAEDTSRLDLSAFTRLEKVDVISNFFFTDETRDGTREGLYRLLPQSLLDLRIIFLPGAQIATLSPTTLTWLSELAVNKAAYFPNLRSVFLGECHGGWPNGRVGDFDESGCYKWGFSEDLTAQLEANYIATQYWVRKYSSGH